jgi:hypothetical protein
LLKEISYIADLICVRLCEELRGENTLSKRQRALE